MTLNRNNKYAKTELQKLKSINCIHKTRF